MQRRLGPPGDAVDARDQPRAARAVLRLALRRDRPVVGRRVRAVDHQVVVLARLDQAPRLVEEVHTGLRVSLAHRRQVWPRSGPRRDPASSRSASRREEPADAAEVARPHRDEPHLAARVRRLDHLAVADVHRDVPDDRMLVEEEVARQRARERDRRARRELRVGVARDRDPVRAVDGPGEPRAVVAPRREPAPEVVQPEELLRASARDRRASAAARASPTPAPRRPGTSEPKPTSVPFASVAVRAVTTTAASRSQPARAATTAPSRGSRARRAARAGRAPRCASSRRACPSTCTCSP